MKEAEDVVEGIGGDVGASGSRVTVKFLHSLILRYVFVVAYMFVQVLLTFSGNTYVPQLCFAPSLRGSVSSKNDCRQASMSELMFIYYHKYHYVLKNNGYYRHYDNRLQSPRREMQLERLQNKEIKCTGP